MFGRSEVLTYYTRQEKASKMPLPPICVWFNGYPGVGKTTVAEKILWLTGFDSLTIVDIDTLILDVKIDLPKDDPNYEKEFEKAIKEQREKGISKYLEDTKKYEYLIFTGKCSHYHIVLLIPFSLYLLHIASLS